MHLIHSDLSKALNPTTNTDARDAYILIGIMLIALILAIAFTRPNQKKTTTTTSIPIRPHTVRQAKISTQLGPHSIDSSNQTHYIRQSHTAKKPDSDALRAENMDDHTEQTMRTSSSPENLVIVRHPEALTDEEINRLEKDRHSLKCLQIFVKDDNDHNHVVTAQEFISVSADCIYVKKYNDNTFIPARNYLEDQTLSAGIEQTHGP